PHKEEAAAVAKHQDPAVFRTQAANTLVRGSEGFHAYNTDYQGILESLKANLPQPAPVPGEAQAAAPARWDRDRPFESRSVIVLGAGGIARAVVFALQSEGALVTIANRTVERAQRLAEEANCRYIDWAGRHNILADVLINCTSVGMHPNLDES